jgi:16S rRNA (adenine1518-N6/adenine1519-N6)-dimethyltransferase
MSKRIPFRPRQSLGQNFLHDPNMVAKIVGTLTAPPDAHVVEVGAGTGALTTALAERYDRLTAIEIDERAVTVLRNEVPGAAVLETDVRTVDWADLAADGPVHVISNTPYHLSTEILFALLEARRHVAEAVLTMQKEVAERIVAETRTKAYGVTSVLIQLFAQPELKFDVSRHVFTPQPDVTSAVLHVRFDPSAEPEDLALGDVRPVVRAAFQQRRKMLRNSLHPWTKEQGIELPNDWGRKRAEALTPGDFAELARHLRARTATPDDA